MGVGAFGRQYRPCFYKSEMKDKEQCNLETVRNKRPFRPYNIYDHLPKRLVFLCNRRARKIHKVYGKASWLFHYLKGRRHFTNRPWFNRHPVVGTYQRRNWKPF